MSRWELLREHRIRGTWATRLRCAWAVLRGRPVAYRLDIDTSGGHLAFKGYDGVTAECRIGHLGKNIRPIYGQWTDQP